MNLDWATIATIMVGNGAVVAVITLIFTLYQNKAQRNFEARQNELREQFEARQDNLRRDFEARREAKDYYLPLYGHIAKLDELVRGYLRCLETGKAEVFEFEKFSYEELTCKEILKNFKNCYVKFSKFYIEKKSEGYELFISEKLKEALMKFWFEAQSFDENTELLKESDNVTRFHKLAEATTNIMEELFGLNQM